MSSGGRFHRKPNMINSKFNRNESSLVNSPSNTVNCQPIQHESNNFHANNRQVNDGGYMYDADLADIFDSPTSSVNCKK